ncbi:hypothetical protein [Sinimarinibacterium thermocellulolyticum]|uniref:Cytochrome c domain-containing protein n=1 Tax=Sinimarinibacterium thermocellulolyticum TaxID=3170016 RepID=A0ABV2ADA0_9GAMM
MRILSVALLLLFAAAIWWGLGRESDGEQVSVVSRAAEVAAQGDSLSARAIPNDDLPPDGTRSLFDHLVAQNDALPYPFEDLVAMIQRQAGVESTPVMLAIPLGRSLLKAQADFHRPRVLYAADFDGTNTPASLGVAARARLFLGFVENAREIEVISYNEAAGRYEFQLVQDYAADGQRRIVYARRAVCMTCHQGGAPIFPQRPWNETNAQAGIAAGIRAARGEAPYLGVPPQVPLAIPERFDELTDVGAFTVTLQRLWIDGCGGDATCRRTMLRLGLRYASNPGAFDADADEALGLRAMQAAHWPADGIGVPESDIRNRDPLAEARGWRARLHAWLTPAPDPDAGAKDNEDLDAFDRLPKLPAELDPLTPRAPKRRLAADALDGVYGVAALFSADDLRMLEAASGHEPRRLDAAVDALPDALFDAAPLSRVRLLQALLTQLGAPVPEYCCLDTSAMSAPVALSAPQLTLAAGSPLQPFAEYCFSCHRGNPAARLDFMSGDTEAAVAANIRGKPEIRDALDWARYENTAQASKLMPPADSAEYARMRAALARDPQLLARMREQVPGLFDF